MKLKTILMAVALVMLMASLSAATVFDIDFTGDGWLDVYFVGYDVNWGSIDTNTPSDLGWRDSSFQVEGDFVVCYEGTNFFTIERYVLVIHGFAEFDHTYQGVGGYGASVQANCGIGFLNNHRVSTDGNDAFSTVAVATDSNYTISHYASNEASNSNPFTLVKVTQSNLAEYGVGVSDMLVSWWSDSVCSNLSLSDSLSSNPVELDAMDPTEWDGSCSVELTSDYEFSVDILSLWQTPAMGIELIEIMEYH